MRQPSGPARSRSALSVRDLPFVGGSLCVDFVNTTGARGSRSERERLHTYADVLLWSRRAGLVTSAEAARLRTLASGRAASARRALSRVRTFRESLYRLLRAVAERTRPEPDDVASMDRWVRRERRGYELVYEDSRYVLRSRARKAELDCMIWPIVTSACAFLTSQDAMRLKRCGECDWLFVDDSKNGSRLWCKKACGDRVRARRQYARRKTKRGK